MKIVIYQWGGQDAHPTRKLKILWGGHLARPCFTVQGAIAAAKKYNKFVTADMIGVSDRIRRGQELQQIGVNYLEIHCGLDEQAQGFVL